MYRRMLKALFAATAILFWLSTLPGHAAAEPIGEVADGDLVDLLNYMEIIAERSPLTEPALLGSIRLVRLRSLGECGDTPDSCPTQTLYVAVSGIDEEPDRKVYELPAAHGWEFKGWVGAPSTERADDYYVFMLEKKVIAADITAGWWSIERYKVSANTHGATLERLP
jgi:hypothetical protein